LSKLDYFLLSLIVLTLIASPFAFGSVHPMAYRPLEAALFGLTFIWCVKAARFVRIGFNDAGLEMPGVAVLTVPILVFAGWTVIQLAPLPPRALQKLSPPTYQLYAHALDGWPRSAPYLDLAAHATLAVPTVPHSGAAQPIVLPTREEVAAGARVPFAPAAASKSAVRKPPAAEPAIDRLMAWIYGGRWRSLSIAPMLTWSSLLIALACGCGFLLTAFYPLGDSEYRAAAEARFVRVILAAILVTGFAVAFIGLIERATWNGKLLWFFIPYDWGVPRFEPLLRACGPFVDPDHFAGYLAMIFPLALACAVFPNLLTPRRASAAFRIQCAVATFVIFVAVLLSLSRAGWLGLMVGAAVMFVLALPSGDAEVGSDSAPVRITGLRLAVLGTVGLLCAAVMFIGPDARLAAEARLNDTTSGLGTIAERFTTWRGGLHLLRDFPIFGVGLGAWSEIFSRYQLPPWNILFADEAHNDYLQLLAESGAIGLLICGWIAVRVTRAITAGWNSLSLASLPIVGALVAGLVAMGAIEFFDFDLRTPAVAILMVLMAGLAIRIMRVSAAAEWEVVMPPRRADYRLALGAAAACIALAVAALAQDPIVYPYNLGVPRSLAASRADLILYPGNSLPHLELAGLETNASSPPDAELKRAVWVDPLNPRTRDRLARQLVSQGRVAEALEQVRSSLLYCPVFQDHYYLVPRLVLWFPPALRDAVERGLVEAVKRGYASAPQSLGDFYVMFGRYDDEAKMYANVGHRQDLQELRARYLKLAGEAYARAGELDAALVVLREAAAAMPDDTVAYCDMAALVYGPRHDLKAARQVAEQGIENGADPYMISVAVGDAAVAAGSRPQAEAAYEQALEYRPGSFDLLLRLSDVYAKDGRPDRAILMLNRAAAARPEGAAGIYYQIAQMEESRYRFYEAEQAYRQAVKDAPNNLQYRRGLADFENRLKAESAADHGNATP